MDNRKSMRKIAAMFAFIILAIALTVPIIQSLSTFSVTVFSVTGNSANFSWSNDNNTNSRICVNTVARATSGWTCQSFAGPRRNWNVMLSGIITNDTTYYYTVFAWNSTPGQVNRSYGNNTQYNFSTLDITPPSAPSSFLGRFMFNGTRSPSATLILNVSWIAPGDNGMKKNATTYYIGYKNTPYTGTDLSGSTRIIKIAKSALTRRARNGSQEYLYLRANDSWFPDGTYYFAIIAEDDGNKVLAQKWNSTMASSSGTYVDKTVPMVPVLWYNYRYLVTNRSKISIYGYTNESWGNVTVYANRLDGTGVSNTNTSIAQTYKTGFLNYSIVREQALAGTRLLKINLTNLNNCPNFVSTSNYVSFSSHNRSYMLFYKINNLVSDPYYCIFNLSQPLEANVPLNTMVRFFNNSRPRGWFNISVTLHTGKNLITAKTSDYYYNLGSAGLQMVADYDNKLPPNLSRSMIQNQINLGNLTMRFNVTDDGFVNISKTTIKAFRYSNRLYNYTFRYPQNISCTARNFYNSSYNCTVNFRTSIPDERYNLTFNTSDSYSNRNITRFYSYYKFRASPLLLTLRDGGILHSFDDYGVWFRFNWTMYPPSPNILYYNYSIGTAAYPNPGWNSIVSWARFNASNANVNYSVVGNGVYRARINFNSCSPACHPVYDNKYFLTIRVFASQNTSVYYSTDGIIFVDDRKPSNPGINIRDMFNETYLTSLSRIRFNYSAYDYSGIKNYEIILSNVSYKPSDGVSFMLPQNLVSHVTLAGTQTDFTITGLSLRQGKDYYIHVRAEDNPGLMGNFSIKKFTVDTTPVVNDSIRLSNTIATNYPVTINAGYDNESGILWERLIVSSTAFTNNACGQTYTQYYTTNLSTSGQSTVMVSLLNGRCYSFRLESKNKAGLTKTTYVQGEYGSAFNRTVSLDTTPPSTPRNVKITSGNNGVITHDPNNLAFEFDTSSDPESGISRYEYFIEVKDSLGNASQFLGPIAIANRAGSKITESVSLSSYGKFLVDDHEYRIKVRSFNNFNLTSGLFNYSDYIIYTDITPPSISSVIVKDANRNALTPISVSPYPVFNISTSMANITVILSENNSYCRFSSTRVLFQDMDNPARSWIINNTYTANRSFAQGDQDLYILCSDQQDNHMDIWDAYHLMLKVDSIPPTVSIVQPQNKVYGKNIQYQFNITDYSGISSSWFRVTNRTNTVQVFISNTSVSLSSNVATGIIRFNQSFDNRIINMSLFVYSIDTRNNVAVKRMNFTLNGRNPTIVFNEPNIIDELFRVPFIMNISITNANYVDTVLRYYDISNTFIFNITKRNASNRNYSITRSINTADSATYPEGRYLILVKANNTYFGNSSNTIELNRTFVIDRSASRYSIVSQRMINFTGTYDVADNQTITNRNIVDNLRMNLSVNWFDPNPAVVHSAVNRVNFSIRKEIKGINGSWINYSAGTSNYYVLLKNTLTPGAKYYWRSSIQDNAGNKNISSVRSFTVLNSPIQKAGSLLNDTNMLTTVLDGDWVEIDLKAYYSDQDYNQTKIVYFRNISGTGVAYYLYNASSGMLGVMNIPGMSGTQYVKLNISDGFSNITQYFNLTFANRTTLNLENEGTNELWAVYESIAFSKKDFDYMNISSGNTLHFDVPRGLVNVSLNDIVSTVVKVLNYNNVKEINLTLKTQKNIGTMNLTALRNMNITQDASRRYEPVLGLDLDMHGQNKKFDLIFNRTITTLNSVVIFNHTSSGINYSDYTIVNLGSGIEFNNNFTNMTILLIRDRSVTEICSNSIDDDYDASIDEGCSSGGSSGGSGGSSGGGTSISRSISFIPKTTNTTVKNATSATNSTNSSVSSTNETKYVTTPKDPTKTSGSQTSQTPANSASSSVSQASGNKYQETPYTENTEEFTQINVTPIITVFVMITLLGTLIILVLKKKPEIEKFGMSMREKIDYAHSVREQKKSSVAKTVIHTMVKPPELDYLGTADPDDKILKYLDYALENDFSLEDARKKLIEYGFDRKHVDKHISIAKERELSIGRIKSYLEKRWDDKKELSKAADELKKVGWPREYISKAMNRLIEEKDDSTLEGMKS